MKRLWIVFGLVVVILGTGFGALFHLSYVTRQMESSLQKITDSLALEDREQLRKLSEDFEGQWEENEAIMMRYIHHDELDTITGTVARLKSLAEFGEMAELSAEVDRLRHLIKHIYESELPVPENIF